MVVIKAGNSGNVADVNARGQLAVRATARSEIETISETEGLAFSWSNVTYDYAALDTILLVKNTSSKKLHIIAVTVSGDTATEVIVHSPTTVASPTGTAVTGVNLNRESGNVAEATAIATETTNTQGNVLWRGRVPANDSRLVNFLAALILASADSIAVDFVTDGAACNVTIMGYFD